ncbi:5-aminolevulinate synthase [Rhizobium etli]|uniref:5-aminolevulinate synthase n=1 Tax=Rhizobium etli TaxID=29449 RepID=UPI0003839A38|nr:5-aminolevulinate synthase [Rhizobium etli]AGS25352.1 5-aminolevulinate synthase 2 [Rhizobium etli bv. mimosae str. Mim1]
MAPLSHELEPPVNPARFTGRYRNYVSLERKVNERPWVLENSETGERRINVWCSNDYLGLSQHPAVIEATVEAVKSVGLGTGGARSISGTSIYHTRLENEIATAHGKEAALLFATGFTANGATLSTICGTVSDIVAFSDSLNHASMIYGIRYSKAEKKIFRHNDVGHLEELLKAYPLNRPKLIAFESLYSMDGDFSPLEEILALAKKYNAFTYLDEIHAAGIYGATGTGCAEELGVLDEIDIIQGGFGKAFGCAGGYIAGPKAIVDAVRSYAPAFVFSTSSPAPVVAAALASFEYNREHPELRARLLDTVGELKHGLKALGIPLVSDDSHILPILVGDPYRSKEISRRLIDEFGIYVQPVNAPTVPEGTERLRVTPTAAHTRQDVEAFLSAIKSVWSDVTTEAAE